MEVRPKSGRLSPRDLGLGGMLVAPYPVMWKSQGGLAAELACVLDGIREDLAHKKPSLQKVENLCQKYDLGTELGRFVDRVDDVFDALSGTVAASRDRGVLKALLDVVGECAWWLLQAYSREELRDVMANTKPVLPAVVTLDSLKEGSGEEDEEEEDDDDKEEKVDKSQKVEVYIEPELPIPDAR